jgi:dihydroflavonol-4-reductase
MRQPEHSFWSGRRVCVTGGSGFLGFQLVRELLAVGANVRVHTLPPAPGNPVLQLPIKVETGDIRDAASVRRVTTGCDVIFHTAGLVGVSGPALRLMHEVHELGTMNVLNAASPKARIVHTSSLVAVGSAARRVPVTEETPFNLSGVRLPYVHAKRGAEEIALRAAQSGQDVVVVNPAYLVGPEDIERSVMGSLCVRFWKGRLPLVPPGGLNLVDVRDVARGHLLAAEYGLWGRRYLMGGEDHSFASLFRLLAEVAGLRPRALPRVGIPGLTLLALLAEGRARLSGRAPFPSFGHVRLNRYFWYCSSELARRELGFVPRPLRESLADAYHWHREYDSLALRFLGRWWLRPKAA